MSIAILATGDEIIHGDTLNTNSQAIAYALCSEGFSLGFHMVCGDKEHEIVDGLDFLSTHHNVIIMTGGLGPTSDDRTRFALARFLQIELAEFTQALQHVQQRLQRANLSMNRGNRQQALFPQGACLFANPHGTALGCGYEKDNRHFFMLPGPPAECLPMLNQYVLPTLSQTKHSDKHLLKWRLLGVAEGEIADRLDQALADIDCATGYRLDTPYLEFKVRCAATLVPKVQDIITPIVAPYLLGQLTDKASTHLCQRIRELAEPIVIVDEITGGRLQMLIQQPETYGRVLFQQEDSVRIQFHLSGLEEYWARQNAAFSTVTIKYQNDRQYGSESYQLPNRSSHIIQHATEWLCFRLLHLIDQLH